MPVQKQNIDTLRERATLHYEPFETPLGDLYAVFQTDLLVALAFERPHLRAASVPEPFKRELREYFEGRLTEFRQPLKLLLGTEFEHKVWLALKDIPYGQTRSYKWMATQVGSPHGSRAVGQALAKNPLPLVLPCHRIIEARGTLGGYTPGLEIKRRLLQHEFYHTELASKPPAQKPHTQSLSQ